jgi:hypothetical protein
VTILPLTVHFGSRREESTQHDVMALRSSEFSIRAREWRLWDTLYKVCSTNRMAWEVYWVLAFEVWSMAIVHWSLKGYLARNAGLPLWNVMICWIPVTAQPFVLAITPRYLYNIRYCQCFNTRLHTSRMNEYLSPRTTRLPWHQLRTSIHEFRG